MALDPQKLRAVYERGILTLPSVVSLAVELAAEYNPADFADTLPDGCVDHIWELVSIPPERLIRVESVCAVDPAAYEIEARERDQRFAEGRQCWLRYFAANDAGRSAAPPGLGD
jgi:hypothetical protein